MRINQSIFFTVSNQYLIGKNKKKKNRPGWWRLKSNLLQIGLILNSPQTACRIDRWPSLIWSDCTRWDCGGCALPKFYSAGEQYRYYGRLNDRMYVDLLANLREMTTIIYDGTEGTHDTGLTWSRGDISMSIIAALVKLLNTCCGGDRENENFDVWYLQVRV